MRLLEGLNPAQKQAVSHMDGPLLVIAGAGAGKTKVITHRIAAIIANGVSPEEIVAVTFTNKAAREMQERVAALLGYSHDESYRGPLVATFHALCVRLLKEHVDILGIPRTFAIYDRADAKRTIKQVMQDAGWDVTQTNPRSVLGAISWQKSNGTKRKTYAEQAETFFTRLVSDVWERYDAALKREGALDFDDLLVRTRDMLQEHPQIREKLTRRFRYIHVDEYQDTNTVQDELIELLAGNEQNVCVVGDLDQCVYSWRGARPQNLLSFEKRYNGAHIVTLEENYRSSQTILTAANELIRNNVNRYEKTLRANSGEGEPLYVFSANTEHDEARFIINTVQERINEGASPDEIAVLYRANFQSRVLEEHFLTHNIPYQVVGTRFFERKEVKDVIAFLRAALADEPTLGDLGRIINTPPRGIGKATLARVIEGREHELGSAAQSKVAAFRRLLSDIQKRAETDLPSETVRYIVQASGLETYFTKGSGEDTDRLENIHELVSFAGHYDETPGRAGAEALLEHAALATDQDTIRSTGSAVRLMTAHAAKGLEFDTVFITGLEEDLFPQTSTDKIDPEEERRLFYVALTRARNTCYLTHASNRTIYGSRKTHVPSSFFSEIDEALLAPAETQSTPSRTRERTGLLDEIDF